MIFSPGIYKAIFACLFLIAAMFQTPAQQLLGQEKSKVSTHEVDNAVLQVMSEIKMPATATGPISKLLVDNGAIVAEDQLLAKIDDEEAKLNLREAQIDLEIVQAQAKSDVDIKFALRSRQVAEVDYRRAKDSNRSYDGVVSDREMDRLQLLVEQSEAELKKTQFEKTILDKQAKLKKAIVKKQEMEVERHRIRAAIRGQVVEVLKREGEWVNVADPVLKVVQLDKLRVEDFLPSGVATRDLVGASATFKPAKKIGEQKEFDGQVVFVSPTIDPLNSKAKVWIEFDNPRNVLRPGMKGSVIIRKNEPYEKKPAFQWPEADQSKPE